MLRRGALVLIAAFSCLAVAWSAAVAHGRSAIPACNHADGQRIEHGAPGPIVCSTKGIKTILVARRTTLPLSSMHVQVLASRVTKSLKEVVDGTTISQATAKGEFVVITLRIANETHTPQSFDDLAQSELEIANNDFSVSTNGDEADSGTQGFDDQTQPGESSTGDIVFDVATKSASTFPAHAGLLLVDYGANVSVGSVNEVGLIYLGAAG